MDKLPKITAEISNLVTIGEVKCVKSWMKETKPQLEEYAREMLQKSKEDDNIVWLDVYKIEATYFNSYEMPVLYIVGRASKRDTKVCEVVFLERFIDRNGCCGHIYAEA